MTAKAGRPARAIAGGDALSVLKGQFDRWRAARRVGERIPPQLWQGAVRAVAEHGPYRVCRELNLDYAELKRRAGLNTGAAGEEALGSVQTPRFIELLTPKGPSMPAPACAQCVVELSNARGARMRVELSGNALAGLGAICQSFWAAP